MLVYLIYPTSAGQVMRTPKSYPAVFTSIEDIRDQIVTTIPLVSTGSVSRRITGRSLATRDAGTSILHTRSACEAGNFICQFDDSVIVRGKTTVHVLL